VGCAEQRKEEEKRRKEKKGRGRECAWRIERREEKKRKWERKSDVLVCVRARVGLKSEVENKVIFSHPATCLHVAMVGYPLFLKP
jgi:hypothetical protein